MSANTPTEETPETGKKEEERAPSPPPESPTKDDDHASDYESAEEADPLPPSEVLGGEKEAAASSEPNHAPDTKAQNTDTEGSAPVDEDKENVQSVSSPSEETKASTEERQDAADTSIGLEDQPSKSQADPSPPAETDEQKPVETEIIAKEKEEREREDAETEDEDEADLIPRKRGEDDVSDFDDEEEIEDEDEYEEDDILELESGREGGDGAEEERAETPDDDEDRQNPAFVPKQGVFYMHDSRTFEESGPEKGPDGEVKEVKKTRSEQASKWKHDKFDPGEQAPKSRDELVYSYGFNIREENEAPRGGERPRKYGRAPKTQRDWRDAESYQRRPGAFSKPGARGRGRGGSRPSREEDSEPANERRGSGRGQRRKEVEPEEWSQEQDFPALNPAPRSEGKGGFDKYRGNQRPHDDRRDNRDRPRQQREHQNDRPPRRTEIRQDSEGHSQNNRGSFNHSQDPHSYENNSGNGAGQFPVREFRRGGSNNYPRGNVQRGGYQSRDNNHRDQGRPPRRNEGREEPRGGGGRRENYEQPPRHQQRNRDDRKERQNQDGGYSRKEEHGRRGDNYGAPEGRGGGRGAKRYSTQRQQVHPDGQGSRDLNSQFHSKPGRSPRGNEDGVFHNSQSQPHNLPSRAQHNNNNSGQNSSGQPQVSNMGVPPGRSQSQLPPNVLPYPAPQQQHYYDVSMGHPPPVYSTPNQGVNPQQFMVYAGPGAPMSGPQDGGFVVPRVFSGQQGPPPEAIYVPPPGTVPAPGYPGPPPPVMQYAPQNPVPPAAAEGGNQSGVVFYDPESQKQMANRAPPQPRPKKGLPIVPPPEKSSSRTGKSPSPPPQEPTTTNA